MPAQQAVARVEGQPPGQVVPTSGDTIMEVIARVATDPNADPDKLAKMLDVYERITARQAEATFNEAMTGAQEALRPVAADATNTHTKSKYASYPALDKAVRPIYTQHGFALSFNTGASAIPEHIKVLCRVSHRDGHSRDYEVDMPADGKSAKGGDLMTKTHAVGAAMSYGQRYLLKLIFNIAVGDDDDGNSNGGSTALQPITQRQADDLRDLIEATGADRDRFLNFWKIEGLSDLRVKDYPRAVAMLEAKRGK